MAGEVLDALCWRGPASVNVFVIGSGNTPLPEAAFHLDGMVPDAFFRSPCWSSPIRSSGPGWCRTTSTFMTSPSICASTREQRFGGCARTCGRWPGRLSRGRSARTNSSERVADQVYGYCVTGAEAVVEWDTAVLRSDEWRLGIAEARAALNALLSASE